jgi:trk system potassium uptake protein TrkA
MYNVIIGGGKVGYFLARGLLDQGHEVLVIERDAAKCERLTEEFGSVVLQGDGCEAPVLEEAGTSRADNFIAVTGDDEVNLVACQVAKHLFRVPRAIARINNPKNEPIFRNIGIDLTVSSTNVILEHIEEDLPAYPLVHLLRLQGGTLGLIEVKVPEGAAAVGRPLGSIELPPSSRVVLIVREGQEPAVPSASTIVEADDDLVAITRPEAADQVRHALTDAAQRS